jgi:hypothetical protein
VLLAAYAFTLLRRQAAPRDVAVPLSGTVPR